MLSKNAFTYSRYIMYIALGHNRDVQISGCLHEGVLLYPSSIQCITHGSCAEGLHFSALVHYSNAHAHITFRPSLTQYILWLLFLRDIMFLQARRGPLHTNSTLSHVRPTTGVSSRIFKLDKCRDGSTRKEIN